MTEENKRTIDLSPDKQVYRAAAVDVTPVDAIEELIDNGLDNWARVSSRADDIEIHIECDGNTTRVTDATGGLGPDEIRSLFALGSTFKQDITGSIGAYGIGAKKAIVRLGDRAVIKSRTRDAERGVGFQVTEEWLSDNQQWSVELEDFDDVERNTTVVEAESSQTIWDSDRVENLRDQLGRTYQKFIAGDVPLAGRVTIVLNGEPVSPPDEIPWSYLPFDGLHPREYENFELDLTDLDEPVEMNVTVGLMRNADSERAGTDFFCQHRLVTESERGEIGGYGSTGEGRIGNFTTHNNRLRVIVEFTTDGDASSLPWDAQKSTIDPYHAVSRAAYDKLRRIVKPYFKANTGMVPSAFVASYDKGHEYAANGGSIEEFDYSGRSNIMDKADRQMPEIKSLRKTAENHAERGVINIGGLEPREVPAYRAHLEMKFDGDLEELDAVEETDEKQEEDIDGVGDLLAGISGAGDTKENALIEAGYHTSGDIESASVEELSQIRGIGEGLATKLKQVTDSLPSSEAEPNPEHESGGREEIEAEESDESEQESNRSEENDTEQIPPAAVAVPGEPGISAPEGVTIDEVESNGQLFGLADDSQVTIPMQLEREEYEHVCERLDVDSEDIERVAEVLGRTVVAMYTTGVPADD